VVTGIEEIKNNGLTVYPQPASSKVFIRSDDFIQSIVIIDVRGEIIKEMSFHELNEIEVPLSGFTPGMYFMRIRDDKGTSSRKFVVVPGN
jgi:hypothetical protein